MFRTINTLIFLGVMYMILQPFFALTSQERIMKKIDQPMTTVENRILDAMGIERPKTWYEKAWDALKATGERIAIPFKNLYSEFKKKDALPTVEYSPPYNPKINRSVER